MRHPACGVPIFLLFPKYLGRKGPCVLGEARLIWASLEDVPLRLSLGRSLRSQIDGGREDVLVTSHVARCGGALLILDPAMGCCYLILNRAIGYGELEETQMMLVSRMLKMEYGSLRWL